MPETIEVRIVAQQLNKFAGQTLTKINILSGPYQNGTGEKYKSFRTSLRKFVQATLGNVDVKGKTMYWELTPQNGENVVVNDYLVIGFGLTGGFRLVKGEHSRIEFVFTDAAGNTTSIYYDDIRNFGTFAFMKRAALNTKLDAMGPDASEITLDELTEQLKLSSIQKHEIAKVLLNQKVLSGIGNYLRAEILYEANINPLTKTAELVEDEEKIAALHMAIHKVLNEVMENAGSPNYEDLNGDSGNYKFKVYTKSKAPNGRPVKKTTLAGRAIYHI
jgi:formamidopyrimidine-DNA glycosylase